MAVFPHSLQVNLLHSKVTGAKALFLAMISIFLSLSTDLWCPWTVNLQAFSLNSATLSSTSLLTVIPMTWSAIKYWLCFWKQEHPFLLTLWLNWKTKLMWTQSGYTRSIINTKCTWSFYTEAMKHLYRKRLACALVLPVALPATSSFEYRSAHTKIDDASCCYATRFCVFSVCHTFDFEYLSPMI